MAYWFSSHSTPASISTDVKLVDLGTVDGAAKSAYMIDSTMVLSLFTTGSESAALRDTAIAAVTRMKELWGMSIDAQVSALCVTSAFTPPTVDTNSAAVVIENRTSDPTNPVNGQMWLRTDL